MRLLFPALLAPNTPVTVANRTWSSLHALKLVSRSRVITMHSPERQRLKWSYFVGQSEGKVKVDSDWL